MHTRPFRLAAATLVLAAVASGAAGLLAHRAEAAALTALSDTLSSSKVSTASSHVLRFTTPSGASGAGQTITITFPSDFNFTGKAIATVTFTHGASTGAESTETLAASPSASAWGAVFSGTQNRVLTLTAPTDGVGAAAVAAGDKVILTYDSTNSVNASTPGNYAVTVAGTFGDTGSITVPILADDQVSVSATVPQSLTFSISDNTIGFGSISPSQSTYATGDTLGSSSEVEAHTITASTNAASGYVVTVRGATLADTTNHSINAIGGTNTAAAPGTEQFGLRMVVSSGSGTGAVTAPYAASGFAYAATATTTSQVLSASGASAANVFSVRYLANAAATTEAGSYAAALNYVATANF